jgi:hypothetical protein
MSIIQLLDRLRLRGSQSKAGVRKWPKWAGSVTHAVKHLLCKCEALSSNPSSIKGKKKKTLMRWENLISKTGILPYNAILNV